MQDDSFLVLERNIIQFRSEEIQIQIQDEGFFFSFLIGSVFLHPYSILDTEDFFYNPFSHGRLDIVSDIAGIVGEIKNLFEKMIFFYRKRIIFIWIASLRSQ